MTIQLLKGKPSKNQLTKAGLHESTVQSDILFEDKIHPNEKESKQIVHETKNRSNQHFRDIASHHQYLLNLIK